MKRFPPTSFLLSRALADACGAQQQLPTGRPACGGIKDKDSDSDCEEVTPEQAAAAQAAKEAKEDSGPFSTAESQELIRQFSLGNGWEERQLNAKDRDRAAQAVTDAVNKVGGRKRSVKSVKARWRNMKSAYQDAKAALTKSGAPGYEPKMGWFHEMDRYMSERAAKIPTLTLEAGAGKLAKAVKGGEVKVEAAGEAKEATATAKAAAVQAALRLSGGGGSKAKKEKAADAAAARILKPLESRLDQSSAALGQATAVLAALAAKLGLPGLELTGQPASTERNAKRSKVEEEEADSSSESDESDLSQLSRDELLARLRKKKSKKEKA